MKATTKQKSAQSTKTITTPLEGTREPRASEVSADLREIESMTICIREQLAIVLVDLFDRQHATDDGSMVLHEPLSEPSVEALKELAASVGCVLRTTRALLRKHGVAPDSESKFGAIDWPPEYDGHEKKAVA